MNEPSWPQQPNNAQGPTPPGGPFGGPGQPAGSPFQQPGGWPGQGGPQRPGPGQPGYGYNAPKKSSGSNTTLWIAGGAIAFFLVIAVFVVAVVVGRSGDADTAAVSSVATEGGAVVEASAASPSDAVRGYLEALAAGDADTALGYVDTVPAEKAFLTSDALAKAAEGGSISGVNVPDVDDKYAYKVSASYTFGGEQVTEDYSVKQTGGNWKVNGLMELDLTLYKKGALPIFINGTKLPSTKVKVFPGSYEFTTESPYVTFGSDAKMNVSGPSAFFESPRLTASLTDAGDAATRKAIKAALNACVAKRQLQPVGCPNKIKLQPNQKVSDSTIRWGYKEDPVEDLTLELDYTNPMVVEERVYPEFTFRGSGSESGTPATFTEGYFSFNPVTARVDLSKKPLKATLK